MKAIYGKLPIDTQYKLIEIKYTTVDDDDYIPCECENCGKLITRQVTITSEKNLYIVGIDCAEKLIDKGSPSLAIFEAKKKMDRIVKYRKFINTKCKTAILSDGTLFLYEHHCSKWNAGYSYRSPLSDLNLLPKAVNIIQAERKNNGHKKIY